MLFDLHVHTVFSPCGHLRIEDLVVRAADSGLDGVCITDHHTMDIRHVMTEGIQKNGLCIIFGMEYTTAQGDFLLFGPFEELAPDLPAEQLLSTVRANGGAAVAAHPFRKARPVDGRLIRQGLCHAVECLNGRNTSLENSEVENWRHYRFARCAGSDAHTLDELGSCSYATEFLVPVKSRMDLIQALNQGQCRPEIRNGGATRSTI